MNYNYQNPPTQNPPPTTITPYPNTQPQPQPQPQHPLLPLPKTSHPNHENYNSAYQYYHHQYYNHQYQQQSPNQYPYTSTHNYHNNYYIHNNGMINSIGSDHRRSDFGRIQGRGQQGFNPFQILQKTISANGGHWKDMFIPQHNNPPYPNQQHNQPTSQTNIPNNNPLTMAQIMYNIDKSYQNCSQSKQLPSQNPKNQSQLPHDNPIKSKITKSKTTQPKTTETNYNNSKYPIDVKQMKDIMLQYGGGQVKNSRVSRFNSLTSQGIFQKVQSIYEMKKVNTEQSLDQPSFNTIKQQQLIEEQQFIQKSRLPPASAPLPNIHKNIRNKITANMSNSKQVADMFRSDFGIQVDFNDMGMGEKPKKLGQEQKINMSNLGEVSQLSPIQRDINLQSIKLPFEIHERPDVIVKLEQSIYESQRRRAKTVHKLTSKNSIQDSNIDTNELMVQSVFAKNKQKPQLKNVPKLQSGDSIKTISQADNDEDDHKQQQQHQQAQQVDQQPSQEIQQSFVESDVIVKSGIRYQVVENSNNTPESVSPVRKMDSLKIKENKKIPRQSQESPKPLSEEKFSIKFTHSTQEPLLLPTQNNPKYLKNNLPPAITASKLTNIITSFSELKQLIEFQFSQFHHYIENWVTSIIKEYQDILMEKEECIFVLQLEKISLEDQLRELMEKNAQESQDRTQAIKKMGNKMQVIIKQPENSIYDLNHPQKRSKSKKKYQKYRQKAVWKELNDMQQILSAQIYKIEAQRDRQFSQVINRQENTTRRT